MDRKLAWMERSAKLKGARGRRMEEVDVEEVVGAKHQQETDVVSEKAAPGNNNVQLEVGSEIKDAEGVDEEVELLRNESLGIRPGAVAVYGSGYPDDGDVSAAQAGGVAAVETPATVQAYAVDELDESEREERIRRGIMANAAEAVVVSVGDPKSRRYWAVGLATVVAAAIAIGIAVPLTNRGSSGGRDPNVLASVRYIERQGDGGYAVAIVAETKGNSLFDGSATTSGSDAIVSCRPKPCLINDTNCVVAEIYEPGCCLGPDCPNGTQCGELCPGPPESCYLTNPANETCSRADCYTCNPVNGQDIYELSDFVWSIDCLHVGTSIRPENGETYKWAIFCGPVVEGAKPELNQDFGQYICAALRLGAGFSDEEGGLFAPGAPCVYIALAECSCGPPDMHTFGLPQPNATCQPGECPYLCEDVGVQYTRNLCHSFPDDIAWWEGQNVFNSSTFFENTLAPNYFFDIYIKGVET
jgi:hypothetical protein